MKKVSIVGLGALGSNLILCSRNWKERITGVDFDDIESKNISAQFHTRMTLGRNKASSIQQSMRGLFGVTVHGIPHAVSDHSIESILGGSNLIIDCTDNQEARQLIQEFAKEKQIPCLHGCLSADGSFALIAWTDQFKSDREDEAGQATCENGDRAAFYLMAATHISTVARNFLDNGKKENRQITESSLLVW